MLFMNRCEIEESVQRFQNHSVLSLATRFLQAYQTEVDNNSDGWPHWNRPVNAAKQLMTLIQHPEMATYEAYNKALRPIKAFYTRHGNAAGMQWPKEDICTACGRTFGAHLSDVCPFGIDLSYPDEKLTLKQITHIERKWLDRKEQSK